MRHSILITHRNRLPLLELCLWSIARSAKLCDRMDYEVVIAEPNCKAVPSMSIVGRTPLLDQSVHIVWSDDPMPIFNKAALFNLAIDRSLGDIITFIDCDAIVGPRWMEGMDCLINLSLVKLCYRVKNLPPAALSAITTAPNRDAYVDDLFAHFDEYRRSFEAWGTDPETSHNNRRSDSEQPYGNSQFSMRRAAWDRVGLRYDEAYVGRGFQDLAIIREVGRQYGKDYKAELKDDGDHAMFHIAHGYDCSWREPGLNEKNRLYYRST